MYNTSNALITVNGVVGTPTVQNNGTDYADVFGFDAIAGKTYNFNVVVLGEGMNTLEESGAIYDANDNPAGSIALNFNGGSGSFTAPTDGRFYLVVGQAGAYLTQFTITMMIAETTAELIDAALASIKTYVDTKDASVKAHAESLVNQLMQTTDLSAKIALLNQVNDILDGDAATAGFQAWEHSLTRLNELATAIENESTFRFNQAQFIIQSLDSFKNETSNNFSSLSGQVWTNNESVTNEIKRIDDATVANFQTMKAKAAVIFAV